MGLLVSAIPLWRQQTRIAERTPVADAKLVSAPPLPPGYIANHKDEETWRNAMSVRMLDAAGCHREADAAALGKDWRRADDVLCHWVTLDAAAAMHWIKQHEGIDDFEHNEVIAAWQAHDPAAFAAWLEGQPMPTDDYGKKRVWEQIINLMRYDLRAATRLAKLKDGGSSVGMPLDREWLFAFIRTPAAAETMAAEILAPPDVLTNIDKEKPLYMLVALRECWQDIDPDGWDRWAAANPTAAAKSAPEPVPLAVRLLRSGDRHTFAQQFLSKVPVEEQPKQIREMVAMWSRIDTTAAGEWLDAQPASALRDAGAEAYALASAAEDPHAAMRWAQTLTDDNQRRRLERRVFTTWLDADPAAATAWLPASGWDTAQREAAEAILTLSQK